MRGRVDLTRRFSRRKRASLKGIAMLRSTVGVVVVDTEWSRKDVSETSVADERGGVGWGG